ncbi:hypothetical protein [Kitasatospora sp. NBC_00458]|uniref:hypothetical protein n=1 Tax=Kitasatospora sp. NBC_00458 TaxID=2903568 RepID=UPI002E197112
MRKAGGRAAGWGLVAIVLGAGALLWSGVLGWPRPQWAEVVLGAGLAVALVGQLLRPDMHKWFDALVAGGVAALVLVAVGTTAGTAGNALRWQRTTERVTVTVDSCRLTGRQYDEVAGWLNSYECRHTWTAGGRGVDVRLATDRSYPNGQELQRWASPGRAELDEHSWSNVVPVMVIATVTDGLVLLLAGVWLGRRVRERQRSRKWRAGRGEGGPGEGGSAGPGAAARAWRWALGRSGA